MHQRLIHTTLQFIMRKNTLSGHCAIHQENFSKHFDPFEFSLQCTKKPIHVTLQCTKNPFYVTLQCKQNRFWRIEYGLKKNWLSTSLSINAWRGTEEQDQDLFLTNIPISCPQKTLENQTFSGVFMGYNMGTLVRNELSSFSFHLSNFWSEFHLKLRWEGSTKVKQMLFIFDIIYSNKSELDLNYVSWNLPKHLENIIDIGEYNTPSMKKDTIIENIIPKKPRQNGYKLIKKTLLNFEKFKYLLNT